MNSQGLPRGMRIDELRNNVNCYSCLHLMDGYDGVKRCRVERNALPVSPALEADCRKYVRATGTDDSVPEWYRDAWHVEGRGD